MKSVRSFLPLVCGVVFCAAIPLYWISRSVFTLICGAMFLFVFISVIVTVFSAIIISIYEFFSKLFSAPKCPNCAKAIEKKATRCPHCESSLTEEKPEKETEKKPQKEMDPELYAHVRTFVAEQWLTSAEKLNPDTLLFDLGIAGDDGYELLEAFCEKFEIQNTSEINPYEYFGGEGCCDLFQGYVDLYYLLFDREKLKEAEEGDCFTPLYLRDLVKSAEAKRWIPPEIT